MDFFGGFSRFFEFESSKEDIITGSGGQEKLLLNQCRLNVPAMAVHAVVNHRCQFSQCHQLRRFLLEIVVCLVEYLYLLLNI